MTFRLSLFQSTLAVAKRTRSFTGDLMGICFTIHTLQRICCSYSRFAEAPTLHGSEYPDFEVQPSRPAMSAGMTTGKIESDESLETAAPVRAAAAAVREELADVPLGVVNVAVAIALLAAESGQADGFTRVAVG